jgi:CIC family chloride channel protein
VPFIASLRDLARRFPLVTAVGIGVVCGVVAVAFHEFVEVARQLLIGRALEGHGALRTIFTVLIPATTFALLALAIRKFAPGAVGANLARVKMAYSRDIGLLGPRSVLATFAATPLSLGAGAPLGPEGPIVVISSGVSMALARWLKLPRKMIRDMIPVGVAAGIAGIFNTPIAGVVFALEEVLGSADRGVLGTVLVGAVAAAAVEKALLGGKALLEAPHANWNDARELIGFAIVGIVSGVVSGMAIGTSHRLKAWLARRLPSWPLRAALAGVVIGLLGLLSPQILGVGYGQVGIWLHGGGTGSGATIAFFVKTIAFVLAISAGVLGGTFAPSLFIGAALGAATGQALHVLLPHATIDPRAYALLGLGAFFAGLLRSPLAAVLIAVELTHDYELIVPLMLAVSLSVAISRRISPLSVVEQQMIDEGYVEGPHHEDPLAQLTVAEAMTANPITLSASSTLLDAARTVAGTRHAWYPVEEEGRFIAVLSRDELDRAGRDGRMQELVRDHAITPRVIAATSERVTDVLLRMQITGVDRCPVIDDVQSRRIVGFLSPGDLLRARMRRMEVA